MRLTFYLYFTRYHRLFAELKAKIWLKCKILFLYKCVIFSFFRYFFKKTVLSNALRIFLKANTEHRLFDYITVILQNSEFRNEWNITLTDFPP